MVEDEPGLNHIPNFARSQSSESEVFPIPAFLLPRPPPVPQQPHRIQQQRIRRGLLPNAAAPGSRPRAPFLSPQRGSSCGRRSRTGQARLAACTPASCSPAATAATSAAAAASNQRTAWISTWIILLGVAQQQQVTGRRTTADPSTSSGRASETNPPAGHGGPAGRPTVHVRPTPDTTNPTAPFEASTAPAGPEHHLDPGRESCTKPTARYGTATNT